MIHKNRGNRRKTNAHKAIKKQKIALKLYKSLNISLHSFSKVRFIALVHHAREKLIQK